MNPTLIAIAVASAIAGSAGFGTAWTLQGRTIDSLKIEAKDALITQQRAARQAIDRATNTVITAQNAAAARNARNAADSSRAADAGSRLRITSATAVRASSTDLETCTRSLDAHSVVLGAVSREAERLAEIADAWAVHAIALQEAWPKFNFTEQPLVK